MPARARIAFALVLVLAGSAFAQSPADSADQFKRGRAAMEAHDPAAAIAHFEQADSKEGRAWLAVALMMESRSPADRFVERAFEAAARSRSDHPGQVRPRAEIAAALRPGEMVIAFLVGEGDAYAWAFDRETFVGYPLPPPAQLAASVEQVKAYVSQQDRAGVQRVAEDLAPALLGPVLERLPSLTRLIFVADGSLRQLPLGELPVGDEQLKLSEQLAVSTVDDSALLDEVARLPSPSKRPQAAWSLTTQVSAGVVIAIVLIAGGVALSRLKRRRSRERS